MPALLHRRRPSHRALCLLLAVLTGFGPSLSLAQQPTAGERPRDIDVESESGPRPASVDGDTTLLADAPAAAPHNLGYAVPNTILYVAVRPAQILSAPIAELYPYEILQAAGIKELGIDPLTAESLVFALAPTLGGPPSYSAVFRFSKPFQLKSGSATEHAVAAEVAGKQYLQSQDATLPSLWSVDDRTLVIAPDFFLRNMLSADKPAAVNPLAASFAAADQGDDLLVMLDVSQLRALIGMGLNQVDAPPEFAALKQLPQLVKQIEVRVNLSREAPSALVVTANDEADAARLVDIFVEMKQLALAKWTAEAQLQLAKEDPVEQAAGRYSLRMAAVADQRLQLTREGDQIILARGQLTGQGSNPLVVASTIGMLVGLLLPAVQAAREAARRNASMNNLKHIMLALLTHESEHKAFPAHANYDDAGKPLLSWRVHVLPYLGQQELYEKFRLDEPWNSEHNRALIAQMPALYLDPSSGMNPEQGKTHYLGVLGEGRFFSGDAEGRSTASITDGTSHSLAIVQTGDAGAVIWTKPDDWKVDEANLMQPFDPLHVGGFLTAFADGSVRFIVDAIDPAIFKALLTVTGDEPIELGDY